MLTNIPDVLLDLLEIAAYVYCADQRSRADPTCSRETVPNGGGRCTW